MPPLSKDAPAETALLHFQEFLAAKVAPIPGWLNDEAALLTACLVRSQREARLSGPVLEIGVFKGKYLSVLYMLAEPGEAVVGVDLFIGASNTQAVIEEVQANVAKACGGASRLKLLVADSLKTSAAALRELAGNSPLRFISVDGGHTREVVRNDMALAYSLLQPGGIIALDDAFNHTTPGVIEGTAEFFLRSAPALAPFAHCYNKLFLTTPDHHRRYLDETRRFVEKVDWLPATERTRNWIRENSAIGFTPEMFGFEIIPFL
ncbi:MAG TPA: class I SAM-dependent methyltransferase [Usitatibacter sp.]|nr:class I SAM-dependent methyltransferase [Usitatibacter sp.]